VGWGGTSCPSVGPRLAAAHYDADQRQHRVDGEEDPHHAGVVEKATGHDPD
jgi:hypothetical protein